MGGYVKGQDADLDLAVQLWPKIVQFLLQDKSDRYEFGNTETMLKDLLR